MKLDQIALLAVAGLALTIGGCASAPAQVAPKPQVATTQLMAAEMSDSDDAPRVGKSQHSGVAAEDAVDAKDAPRRDDRKHGGGFSGWK